MSQDDDHEQALEVAAATVHIDHTIEVRRARDFARTAITAYLSAMPQRVSPDLIAQLNKLATYLTAQGEYEACDLIDTVVARVTAMPERELLAEALDALDALIKASSHIHHWHDGHDGGMVVSGSHVHALWEETDRARAAADKIRASLTQEKQT